MWPGLPEANATRSDGLIRPDPPCGGATAANTIVCWALDSVPARARPRPPYLDPADQPSCFDMAARPCGFADIGGEGRRRRWPPVGGRAASHPPPRTIRILHGNLDLRAAAGDTVTGTGGEGRAIRG